MFFLMVKGGISNEYSDTSKILYVVHNHKRTPVCSFGNYLYIRQWLGIPHEQQVVSHIQRIIQRGNLLVSRVLQDCVFGVQCRSLYCLAYSGIIIFCDPPQKNWIVFRDVLYHSEVNPYLWTGVTPVISLIFYFLLPFLLLLVLISYLYPFYLYLPYFLHLLFEKNKNRL